MYLQEYRDKNGIIIFSALDTLTHGSLTIEGNKQKMILNSDDWKKVTTANETEIIAYEDSEGNRWDLSYGVDFPYSYGTLTEELISVFQKQMTLEADEYDDVAEKVLPMLNGITRKTGRNNIIQYIRNQAMTYRKMASECEQILNPNANDIMGEDCEVRGEEPQSYSGAIQLG